MADVGFDVFSLGQPWPEPSEAPECGGDFGVGEAGGDQLEDFDFATRPESGASGN
jgi:hypothetical protein